MHTSQTIAQCITPQGVVIGVSSKLLPFFHEGAMYYEVLFQRKAPPEGDPFPKVLKTKEPQTFCYKPFADIEALEIRSIPLLTPEGTLAFIWQEAVPSHATSSSQSHLQAAQMVFRQQEANEHLRELVDNQKNFLALAAHQLRQPLFVLRGQLEFFLDDPSDENKRQLLEQSDRATTLVDRLFEFAEREIGERRPTCVSVDMRVFLKKVYESFRSKMTNHVFDFRFQTRERVLVSLDPQEMQEVLWSLLENAQKYVPSGKKITLGLRLKEKTHVEIFVQDEGNGVPEDVLEHLFDPFYRDPTAKSLARGRGLGLTIARQITEAHHGTIEAFSQPKKGTSFVMTLPRT